MSSFSLPDRSRSRPVPARGLCTACPSMPLLVLPSRVPSPSARAAPAHLPLSASVRALWRPGCSGFAASSIEQQPWVSRLQKSWDDRGCAGSASVSLPLRDLTALVGYPHTRIWRRSNIRHDAAAEPLTSQDVRVTRDVLSGDCVQPEHRVLEHGKSQRHEP